MQVKRYEAATIREALAAIKKDLGPDAVVLSTKKVKGASRSLVEVLAARDAQEALQASAGEGGTPQDWRRPLASVKAEMDELKTRLVDPGAVQLLRGDLAELQSTINAFFDVLGGRRSKEPHKAHLARLYNDLVGNGVSKAQACTLMERVRKEVAVGEDGDGEGGIRIVEKTIAESFPVLSGKRHRKRIKVFLGPTGVGKTTTLAKLAARYALTEKLNVGLVTTDTYRIAAAEQLKTYAKIIGIPLEVASEKKEFERSLARFTEKDLILVDTPGRGRRDETYLRHLKDMLTVPSPVETHLLLSLAASRENNLDAASRFGMFDCDAVILTKLDECIRPGVIYDLMTHIGKPVSYVTNGQNVPQDIEQASPGRLTKLVMGAQVH